MLISEISLPKGGAERLKNENASKCAHFEMLFPLHIGCIKAGSATVIYFWGCNYIRVENFVADVVFQGVTAFKTVPSDIFVAFLSLFYFSITESAKAVTADISYFGAILFKKITRVVLQASRLYAMKDGSQKSEILSFVTLFFHLYFAAYRVHRGNTCHNRQNYS